MHFKDRLPSHKVRFINRDLAIETTGTKQRAIQYIGTIGRRQYNDACIRTKTIHFNKQLVQCTFSFIITHHYVLASCATDGIDLIDEDDTRCFFPCLLKEIAYAACTNTYKHLNEIRT